MTTRQAQPDTLPEPATLDDHDELVELVEGIAEELQAEDDGEDDIMAAYLARWRAYDVQPDYMRDGYIGA